MLLNYFLYVSVFSDTITKVFILGLMVAFLGFWIFMVIDTIRYSKEQGIFWIFFVFILWTIGSFYYYFKIYRRRKIAESSGNDISV